MTRPPSPRCSSHPAPGPAPPAALPTVRLPPPYPLKEVEVPIVENQLCDAEYHTGLHTGDSFQIVRDDMLCAGSEKHDSCQVGPRVPHPDPRSLASER